jgi:hypothetical protein
LGALVAPAAAVIDDAPPAFEQRIFRHNGAIHEANHLFVADNTRFQKFTFKGKRGDYISLHLRGPVVGEDVDGELLYGDVGQLRLLYELSQGLETAPRMGDEHRLSFEFSADKVFTIYVATKEPGQTPKYHLTVETATRVAPGPVYMHFPKRGVTEFGKVIVFDCGIGNENGLLVEATGVDFLPIIEFGRGKGSAFESLAWAERTERGNQVSARAEAPPGSYVVRVSPQPTVGGTFDLLFLLPQKLRLVE